jgi:hypothetical protein
MVACSHLKTVRFVIYSIDIKYIKYCWLAKTSFRSRKELDTLGDSKRGWKKSHESKSSGETILLQEADCVAKKGVRQVSTNGFKKPKGSMELNRDWRRVKTREEKIR